MTEEEFRTGSMPQKYAGVAFGSLSNGACRILAAVPRRPPLSALRRVAHLTSLGFSAPLGMEDTLRRFRARPRIRIRQDGFIIHDGGECPVPPWTHTNVEIEWKDGSQGRMTLFGGATGYSVPDAWTGKHAIYRIVAYRIVR